MYGTVFIILYQLLQNWQLEQLPKTWKLQELEWIWKYWHVKLHIMQICVNVLLYII